MYNQEKNLNAVEVELTETKEVELLGKSSVLIVPDAPLRRKSSLTNDEEGCEVREHNFEIIGDPGIVFTNGLGNLNAYVKSINFTKAPAQITIGMQLLRVNNTELEDMEFYRIIELYQMAVKAEEPMTLILVDVPPDKMTIQDLSSCPDVREAVVWKSKMEDEHWNKSLKARAVVFVDGLKFQLFIILVILFDFTLFMVETFAINHNTPAPTGAPGEATNDRHVVPSWIIACTWIVLAIYVIEICVRIYGYGIKLYCRKKFCVFDFVVVLLCVVMQILEQGSWFSILRGVRVGKILLVFRAGARLFTGVHSHIPTAIRYKVRMNKMQFRGEFNLDLCYITKRIISMSVPSEGREQLYRNPIDKVVTFFEKMHKDKYMVYDLCEERSYDYSKFQGRVEPFKFTDHSVPTITKMLNFCKSVERWMNLDPENVIAVHCKGGKGRTGTMVCAWLLYCYRNCAAQEAIDFFAKMRTNLAAGGKYQGIETSSQVRYVHYFWDFIHIHKANMQIFKSPFGFNIRSIRIGPFYSKSLDSYQRFELDIFERSEIQKQNKDPKVLVGRANSPDIWSSLSDVSSLAMDFFVEYHERSVQFNSITSKSIADNQKKTLDNQFYIVMEPRRKDELFKGNLRFDFFAIPKKKLGIDKHRKWLISFWLSTNLHPLLGIGQSLTLTKFKLDKVQKDTDHRKYPKDFQVEVNACLSNSNCYDKNTESNVKGSVITSWKQGEGSPQISEVGEDLVHEL